MNYHKLSLSNPRHNYRGNGLQNINKIIHHKDDSNLKNEKFTEENATTILIGIVKFSGHGKQISTQNLKP